MCAGTSSSTSFSYSGYQKRSPRGAFDSGCFAGIRIQQAPDEAELFHTALELRDTVGRTDARCLGKPADTAKDVGEQLHFLRDDVVGLLDVPLNDLRRTLAVHHLIGARGKELEVDSYLTQLFQVRASLEDRLVQRLEDLFVGGLDAAATVGASVRNQSRLVDVQTVRRSHVSVGIDDHLGLLFFLGPFREKPRARTPSR